MNKKMIVTKFTSFGMKFRLQWTESKYQTTPWISIFKVTTNTAALDAVKTYEIKAAFAEWFAMNPDDLRINVLGNKVVIYDLNKVGFVKTDAANTISWKYINR